MSGKLGDSESWEMEVEEMLTEYRHVETRVKCISRHVSRLYIKSNICAQRSHNNSKSNNFGGGNLEMYFV